MRAEAVPYRAPQSPFALPVKDWFIYLFLLVSPFYMFSIFFDRDWGALWVLLGLSFVLVLDFLQNGGRLWYDSSFGPLAVFVGVYLAATLVILLADTTTSFLERTPQDRALTTTTRLAYVAIVYMVFVTVLAQGDDALYRRVFIVQMVVGAVIAVLGILQYVTYTFFAADALIHIEPTNKTYKLYSSFALSGGERVYRASAVFNEPSAFGFFLVPLFVKAVVARIQQVDIGSRTVQLLLIGIFALAIVVNLSLTAVLAVSPILVFLLWHSLRHTKHFMKVLIGVGIVMLVIAVSPLGSLIIDRVVRVFSLQDGSTLDRMYRQYFAVKVFLDDPWLGVGPGGFAFAYVRSGGLIGEGLAAPLNMWLSFLTDVGIIGSLPLFVFLVSVIRRGLAGRGRHPLVRVYLWGLGSLLILQTTNDYWYGEVFWFELAMLIALVSSPALKGLQRTDGARPSRG